MAEKVRFGHFEKVKSPKQLKRDWYLTVMAIIVTTLLLLTAISAALLFAILSPYTTAPAVGP